MTPPTVHLTLRHIWAPHWSPPRGCPYELSLVSVQLHAAQIQPWWGCTPSLCITMGVISGHRFLGKPPRAPQQWPRPLPTAFLRQTGGDTHRAALHVACALSFVWFPPRRCPPGLGRIESAHFSFHYFLLHLTVEDFLLWELSVAQLWFG